MTAPDRGATYQIVLASFATGLAKVGYSHPKPTPWAGTKRHVWTTPSTK